MSWEIYLTSFENGESCEFSKAALIEILQRESLDRAGSVEHRVDFLYADGYLDVNIDHMKTRTDGFALDRFFYGLTALNRTMEAATVFRCLIYWPAGEDDDAFAVTSSSVLEHLPSDLPAEPVVVTSAEEFVKVLRLSGEMPSKERWLSEEFSELANTRDH